MFLEKIIAFDFYSHMEEDLTGMHVHHKSVSEMSDEEKSFYYFKIHDTDNNDYLDGLEMIKAAIHRHGNIELQEELSHVISEIKVVIEIKYKEIKFSFQVSSMSFLISQMRMPMAYLIMPSTFRQ